MAKKHKYQVEGMHYSPTKGFHTSDLEINLPPPPSSSGSVKGAGKPISAAAFAEMQRQYHSKKKKGATEHVIFSREAILSILAQHQCAGIKFHFVERHNTKRDQLTLAMVGVDEKNKELITKGSGKAISAGAVPQNVLMSEDGIAWPPK